MGGGAAVGGAIGGVPGAVAGGGGLDKLGDYLGFGQQGEYYQPGQLYNPAQDQANQLSKAYGDQNLSKAVANYGTNQNMSLQDAINGIPSSEAQAAYHDMLAMDPLSAQKMATEQVQNNAILGGLFGKGGALERAGTEEKDLASRGYSLKPEDYEAYGQASGDIARMFGQQEQDLTQSLAARGLGSAPSGAAGAGFSGLQGNKMEQLAKSQRDIADKRMNMNLQRLNETRNYLSGLGQQGQNAIFNAQKANLAGVGQKQGFLGQTSQGAVNQYGAQEQANQASMLNKQSQKSPTFGQMLGMGVGKVAANAAPNAASFATGGVMGG